jgi:hypothetical protein
MNTPRLPIAGLVTAGAIFLSAAPSLAASVTPTIVDGNPTCAELGALTGHPDWQELKIDPPKGGTYTSGDGAFKVTVTTDGQSFDFSVADGELVDAAFAKAGDQGGNLYDYSPAGINADTDLVAPTTGGGDNQAALSHITFCYTPDKTPPPADTPTPKNPPVVEEPPATPPVTQDAPPAATVTPEQPAAPVAVAAPAQVKVLGKVVTHKAKKAKKAKKKARRKVKAVKVKAVRAPKFTG